MKQSILKEKSRDELMEMLVNDTMRFDKENDGIETGYSCLLMNGNKGYHRSSDKELLSEAVERVYGICLKWED